MSEYQTATCLVCRKHRGEVDIPGGVIYEDDLIFIAHAQLFGDEQRHYLGHVFVEVKRHVAELAELTEPEAQAVGLFTSRVAQALLRTQGMEHVYSFFMGDGVPHVHIHVIGRCPNAPRQYWGARVDEWPDAPKGTATEMAKVAARVRDYLREHYGG